MATISYKGSTIATLEAGQSATLKCAGMKMDGDVVVEVAEQGESPLPIEISTETEMNALLTTADIGAVYKYVGETTDTFENGALYIVEAVSE